MRYALSDLYRLATDEAVYERYVRHCESRARPTNPVAASVVATYLPGIEQIAHRLDVTQNSYTGGVVLSVRVRDEDLPQLEYKGPANGVIVHGKIPPDRIIRITPVPPDYDPWHELDQKRFLARIRSPLLLRIQAQGGKATQSPLR